MFGPFDGNVMENGCQQMGQSYSTGSYASNVSQTNFFSSLLTDFVTETDYNYNSYQSYVYTDSGQNAQTFDSSEASSPPPTPDIISSFAAFAAESPLSSSTTTATVETTPTYQNLCSPLQTYNCPLQSPTSSCSSISMASPSFTYDETKKQLIKDSLRLTIQSRRSAQGLDLMDACDMSSTTNTESDTTSTPDLCLTEADSERRRRRRERNKVAATKCRNKKKLHSIKLHQESESLQLNNAQMRKEIEDLRRECQQLMSLLSSHESNCKQQTNSFSNNYTNYFHNYDQNNNNINCNNSDIISKNISYNNNNNINNNNSYYVNNQMNII